jgi:hypothetical protein
MNEEDIISNGDSLDFEDDDGSRTTQPTPQQQVTEQEVKENPFISLVEYNMGRGSPVSQFFNTFDENSRDPFKAATNLSIGFSTKMQNLDNQTKENYLRFVVGSQAERLSSALLSYDNEMRRATGYGEGSQRTDTYKPPSGFISRPTHYDTYSLLANEQARGMSLRMSMYQVQEINTVAGINQRRASTELVTQSFLNSDYSAKGLGNKDTQDSMRVLLGNDVTLKILENKNNITAYGVSMPESSYLHAKVGYLSVENDSSKKAETSFISTQNITGALSKAHTAEEMLVLTRGDIYRSFSQNPNIKDKELDRRESIRGRLIDEIKAVTDAIYDAAADQQRQLRSGVEAISQSTRTSHNLTLNFRDNVYARTEKNLAGLNALPKALFVGEEIQKKILEKIQSAANDHTKTKKVILSIQYLERIFYADAKSASSNNSLQVDMRAGSDYHQTITRPFLAALETLAQQDRLSLATSATSFGRGQGLFSLLDDYHAGKLPEENARVLTTLLEKNSFSLLPTKFAHSKSFAILDGENKLFEYGIGSANWGLNSHLTNVEATLILDQTTIEGLTDREQQDIASYYYHGVSNFGRKGQLGSFTEARGSADQTRKLVSMLVGIGGVDAREKVSNKGFIFSKRYDINRKGELSGLDIQIPGLEGDSKGYSFSVTVGQEHGLQDYQPVVYLSKNNRVINGMIYKNDSKQVLKLYNGVELAPGETRQFGALEVVAGLVHTMQHTMKFEAANRSLQLALSRMSPSSRQQGLSNVLGSLAQQQAQQLGLLSWTETIAPGLDKTLQAIGNKRVKERNFFQRLMGSPATPGIEQVLLNLSGRLQLPLAESSLGVENPTFLKERADRIRDIVRPDKASYTSVELLALSSNIVQTLDKLLISSLGNSQTSTLYHDLLRLIVNQDDVARDLYERSQQSAKRDLFSQQTSAFMQPHELRYSFGQALYKTPVFGINDDLYNLAESQSTLGFLLSPHALRHGESLGGSYIRAIADSIRFTERDLYKNQGGIYKAEGGAASIRDTESMLSTMRQLGILRREDYVAQVLASLRKAGLSDEQAAKRAKEQEEEVFKLLTVRGSSSSSLFYFPYRVTEQISQRLKNLQSGRPVEAASKDFGRYADTLGVFSTTADPLQLENMLAGSMMTSIPEHQFKYLQKLLEENKNNPDTVLNYIKRNIHGDSMSLVRGFLGGTSPKRVLQSMGIATMSDFAYVNADYRDETGNRPEYTLLHKTTMTLDATRLQGNVSFEQQVRQKLTKGVTFLALDTLIEDTGLRSLLEKTVLDQLNPQEGDDKLNFVEKMQSLDAGKRKNLEDAISLRFETVQFKSSKGQFYFRRGVQSAAVGSSPEERLTSKKMIGQLEESKGYFTIKGLYEYDSLGGQQKATQLLKFKLPAVSQRVYRGVTVLHEDPRISQTGSSTITLELDTSTRRDTMSGLRPGTDTSKGPDLMLSGDLFDALEKSKGTNTELLPERLRDQSIYAILTPSQIKGFNFEQGLMLIEDRHDSSFLKFVGGDEGGAAVAEGLALMMLKEKVDDNETISRLLGEHLKTSGKSQAALALLKPGSSQGKALPVRGRTNSITDAAKPTFQIFGELTSLALPEFLNDNTLSVSQALVKTVSLALGTGTEANQARERLKTRALSLFGEVRTRTDRALGVEFDQSRYIFNDSFDSRSASVLAYFIKAGQDLLGDIDTNQRLNGASISEVNPAYFMGSENRKRYLGETADTDPRTRLAMIASVRRVASGLNVHLPRPEDINNATGQNKEMLEKQLEFGLAQVNAMLRLNRFMEFGIEKLPSKIAVAVGMQNMTKMEGHYALELSKAQLGLYTDTLQEKQDVLSIQQAVLLLGGLMEGQLPDPYRASTLYGLKVTNLASLDEQVGISKSMRFATNFLSNFSRVAEKTLPTVVAGERGFTSPLAKDAVLAYIYNPDGKDAKRLVEKMGLVRQLAGGIVMPSSQDAEDGVNYRRRQIERRILQEVQMDGVQKTAIQKEVVSIFKEFSTAYGKDSRMTSQNPYRSQFIETELPKIIIERSLETLKNKQTLIAPIAYYESFFTKLTTSVAALNPLLLTDQPNQKLDIAKYLTEDLLRDSGVYEHYQADINRRITASQNTESGTEYLQYGMEVLRSVSHTQKSKDSKDSKHGKDPTIEQAKNLYETISKTKRLVLPALIGHGMSESGKHTVSYAPTTSSSPNQGLLLGLDLMQKISLVFQGESHAALTTQVALSDQLTNSYSLLERLSGASNRSETTELDDYELAQYRRLEFLMRESVETTGELLNNQETIRQAATDRLKLSGMSAIAMSSLLLAEDEVAFGSRFTEVTQRGQNANVKAELKTSRAALLGVSKSIVKLNASIDYLEGQVGTTTKQVSYRTNIPDSNEVRSVTLFTGLQHRQLANLIQRYKDLDATRNKMQSLVDNATQNSSLTEAEYKDLETFRLRDKKDEDGIAEEGKTFKKGYVSNRLLKRMGLDYEYVEYGREYDESDDNANEKVRIRKKASSPIDKSDINVFKMRVAKTIEDEQKNLRTKIEEKEKIILENEAKLEASKQSVALKESQLPFLLDKLVDRLNQQRQTYYSQTYGQELPETEYITRSHVNPLIDGYRVASVDSFMDYTSRLISSRQINSVEPVKELFPSSYLDLPLFADFNETVKAKTKTRLEEIEKLYSSSSTEARQGGPYGAALPSESATALLNIVGVGTVDQRARETDTLVRLAKRESATLMLVSALGMHYTELGDYDGDSFQGAMTQLANVTRRIQQQQAAVDKLSKDKSNLHHDSSLSTDKLNAISKAEVKAADEELSLMIKHKNELLNEHRKIKIEAKQRANKGLRAYTSTYTAIPREMMGEGGILPDESLQSLVKQFRDTLDGIYGNTKHATDAVGVLTNDVLSKLQLTKQNGEFKVTGMVGYTRDEESRKLLAAATSEFDYYYQDIENKDNLNTPEDVINAIILQQANVASFNASMANSDKRLASATGSILDAQGINEIQSILGASGTGLLGSTYNTVVPLVAIKMGEITAQRAMRGDEGASYRMAMAAGLTREINQRKAQLSTTDQAQQSLINQLEQRRNSYFNSGQTLSTNLRLDEGNRQLEVAMRFVITTQQFLRDAAIKPKESKKGTNTSKTIMLEVVDDFFLPADELPSYGIQLPEGQDNIKGLTNILNSLTGDSRTIKDNRESILTRFLGEKVGNDLDIYLGEKETPVYARQAKAFAALKLITEYVSGNFEDSSAMMEQSVFKDILKAAQTREKYAGQSADDFISNFITDLTSAFQSEYIFINSLEIQNRVEFARTGQALLDLYGVKRVGTYNKDDEFERGAIDSLVDRRKAELLEGLNETSAIKTLEEGYLKEYRIEQEGMQEAIAKATSGLNDDFEIFEAGLRASINKTLQNDQQRLKDSINELKNLHSAIGEMREGSLPSNLEQNLSLYSTAFAQQLAAGKIDPNIWMGFYAQALPEIAGLAAEAVKTTNPGIENQPDKRPAEAAYRGFFSMLGLQNTSIGYNPDGDNNPDIAAIEARASRYVRTNEYTNLNLAMEYTVFTNPSIDKNALKADIGALGDNGKYLSEEAEALLFSKSEVEGKPGEREYRIGLEAIKGLELNTSAAEQAANQSAFTYTMSKLNQEYTSLVAEQAANNINLSQAEDVREKLNVQYDAAIDRLQAQMDAAKSNSNNLRPEDHFKTVQDIQNELNRNLTATIKRATSLEVNRISRESRRSHSISEAISVLAVPALFALMQNRASASEQAIELLSNTAQSYLSSSAVADPTSEGELAKTAQRLRTARIRNSLTMGGGSTESLLTGIAFESIFNASSVISNKVVDTIGTRSGGFAATPLGRLTGEVVGGVVGMGIAGLLTNRKAGLPGEGVTEQDMADRIIEGIKQSTREAAERFSEQIIAQASVDVFDEEDGATMASSSDYNNNSGFLTAMELDELTGVTLTTYEGDEIPTYLET